MTELTNVHPGLRKSHVSTLPQFMRNQLRPQRDAMNLLGRLGALALGLTVLGVYGMMSYIVRQRTRELGIRMAIGAQRADIAKLILHFGACLSLAGMILGLPLAFCGSFLLRHAVFGISPFELQPVLFAAEAVLLAILCACAIPAVRATRVNPMQALRYE
jgi:ABC-type antimicrobial peptide transport system permease subunit